MASKTDKTASLAASLADRQAEIDAEETAADYVGKAAARKMAEAGYFRDQVARDRARRR